jgi:hypothetical protein
VSEDDAASIGGHFRLLSDILTEVADGTSEFVFVG